MVWLSAKAAQSAFTTLTQGNFLSATVYSARQAHMCSKDFAYRVLLERILPSKVAPRTPPASAALTAAQLFFLALHPRLSVLRFPAALQRSRESAYHCRRVIVSQLFAILLCFWTILALAALVVPLEHLGIGHCVAVVRKI
jgi:hypothetical protein